MAVVKSPALHDWLLRLNFTIFIWQLNIGDWIEVALDWAISWVNYVLSWAEAAYNWAQAAWSRAGELVTIVTNYINAEVQKLLSRLDALWNQLDTWWAARKWELQEWVRTLISTTLMQFDALRITLMQFMAAWEDFRRYTLPGLLSLNWFRSWWGKVDTPFDDWWAWARQQLHQETDARLQPVIDQVRQQQSFLDSVRELFRDPEQWLLDRIESMLARFW